MKPIYIALTIAAFALLLTLLMGSCTNRQLHDKWEARGIRRGWLDTSHAPTGVIKQDSNSERSTALKIDSLIENGFKDNIPGVVPIYIIGKDTCLNKSSVSYLIKWKAGPVIENKVYQSFNFEDKDLLLYLEYDKNGKPQLRYKIKTPTHIIPPHTPTLGDRALSFLKGLGWWLLALVILCVAVLVAIGRIMK